MTEFKIGDIVEGQITGIQNYGVFVGLSPTEQGLVHISECKHGYMNELSNQIKVGDKVKVMVIDIDEYTKKISLSMRVLMKLNTPPYPARTKKRATRHLPDIGFSSVAKKLPEWIDSALQSIEEDRFEVKQQIK